MIAVNVNTTKNGILVEPGQIWRDLDKRMNGRTVRVESVEDGKAVVRGKSGPGFNYEGKSTKLSVRRMHKHSTGWELVP